MNPYINWPFEPRSVELMDNYTTQSNALGMQVKFFEYTLCLVMIGLVSILLVKVYLFGS